jgi:hypothetical protein
MREQHRIETVSDIALLTRAAECVDRIATAVASIAKDGALVETQYGTLRANPAVTIEKQARDGFYSAMRLLDVHTREVGSREAPPWAS